jgi:hypothetical protein
VNELVAAYHRPEIPVEQENELRALVSALARRAGMEDVAVI